MLDLNADLLTVLCNGCLTFAITKKDNRIVLFYVSSQQNKYTVFIFSVKAGSRPMQSMQMHRSEKNTDAFIGQIFTANNEKQPFLRKHKAYNAQILTKLLFPRNEYKTYSKIYI